MAYTVRRPNLTFWEKLYIPNIIAGLLITLKHVKKMLNGETKVIMQYPEEKWDSQLPEYYRGAPTLVKDDHDRERADGGWSAGEDEVEEIEPADLADHDVLRVAHDRGRRSGIGGTCKRGKERARIQATRP